MCRAASRHGITTFNRNSFGWSLSNAPTEWQWEIHALAAKPDGQRLGWSYAARDWYVIPDEAPAMVGGAAFTCPAAG